VASAPGGCETSPTADPSPSLSRPPSPSSLQERATASRPPSRQASLGSPRSASGERFPALEDHGGPGVCHLLVDPPTSLSQPPPFSLPPCVPAPLPSLPSPGSTETSSIVGGRSHRLSKPHGPRPLTTAYLRSSTLSIPFYFFLRPPWEAHGARVSTFQALWAALGPGQVRREGGWGPTGADGRGRGKDAPAALGTVGRGGSQGRGEDVRERRESGPRGGR
jgi:hypothetical protein